MVRQLFGLDHPRIGHLNLRQCVIARGQGRSTRLVRLSGLLLCLLPYLERGVPLALHFCLCGPGLLAFRFRPFGLAHRHRHRGLGFFDRCDLDSLSQRARRDRSVPLRICCIACRYRLRCVGLGSILRALGIRSDLKRLISLGFGSDTRCICVCSVRLCLHLRSFGFFALCVRSGQGLFRLHASLNRSVTPALGLHLGCLGERLGRERSVPIRHGAISLGVGAIDHNLNRIPFRGGHIARPLGRRLGMCRQGLRRLRVRLKPSRLFAGGLRLVALLLSIITVRLSQSL
jgi:hypothetical protein